MDGGVATIPHGTPHGYNYHRCRCDHCRGWRSDYNRAYNRANVEKIRGINRRRSLKEKFGVTHDDYEAMLDKQNGGCAICGAPEPTGTRKRYLEFDHNHTTGEVRGLLCNECNTSIGKFKDDPELLRKAALYLEKYA